MILKLNLPFRRTFLLASIPLILYSLICCIETIIEQLSPLYENSLLLSSKYFLLEMYSNYPLFMLAMLILSGLIDTVKTPKEAEPISKSNKIISQMIRNLLCFTLIYACFQFITSSLPQHELSENFSLNSKINGLKEVPRILDEEEVSYSMRDSSNNNNIELFEIGKLIGSRSIANSIMTISKDGKILFLVEEYLGLLRIIDISDNQNPRMLSTLTLKKESGPVASLLLSADEKTLYFSNSLIFEIVDVSSLKSPISVSYTFDPYLMKLGGQREFNFHHTSMALSWNEKTLYVGGCGVFQIFSVEIPHWPRLIFSSAKNDEKETLFGTSFATSADRKTLYFANGTIEVYDISVNPEKPVLKNTFKGGSLINSLLLGKDNKTLYAVGRTQEMTMVLEKLIIEENSPFLKTFETFNMGIKSTFSPSILEKSVSESTFFFFITYDIQDPAHNSTSTNADFRAYNLVTREILSHSKDLFPNPSGALRVIPHTKNFVISKESQLNIVSFLSNYPNPHFFALSNNTVGLCDPPRGVFRARVPSTMGIDRLYTIINLPEKCNLSIIDMSNKNEPEIIASLTLDIQARSLFIVEGANRAFAIDEKNAVQVLDFSDLSNHIQSLGVAQLEKFDQIFPFNDGKTVLTNLREKVTAKLKMLDFSDLLSIKVIAEETTPTYDNSIIQVSSQGVIFLCLGTHVEIYNLSAPASSRKIGSIKYSPTDKILQYGVDCRLFEEKGVLFIETHNQDTMHYLSIFNISKITSPEFLTLIPLPKFRESSNNLIPTRISSDASRAYFWDLKHILAIDISADFKSHVILGQIPVPVDLFTLEFLDFYISGDNKFGYLNYENGKILTIDLQAKYSLFMDNNNFALGKKYAADLMFLKLNKKSHFERFAQSNYKIIKLSLAKISLGEGSSEAQTKLSSLPDWITFDKDNSLLNIESKKERDLGNYTLHSACSLKVPFEAFDFIGNRSAAQDFVASLIAMGFLDNQRFLTSSFYNFADFFLPSQYSSASKLKIYNTLLEYSFETFTPLRLEPSLNMKVDSDYLSVITPSFDVIKVDIKLKYNSLENDKENPQFLLRPYGSIVPVITELKTRIRLEGLLSEVNMALERLVINNKTLDCDGEIIITDNLNQPLVREVKNIGKYFTNNKPPRVSLEVQNQIDMVPVYTGEFVTIVLNQRTFIDENVENLDYKLVMNTPERHEKPSWIAFSNDMEMKITPPEQILNRKVELLLIAENEFEKIEVPFTLKIKLSPVYMLKLLLGLSPYLLTIIGLYIKANKIYNIVAQKWYKHPKEFSIEIEREIGPDVIPPICFIAGENKEVKLIMQEVCRKIASDLECPLNDKEKIVDYFLNSEGELDSGKLRQTIEEIIPEMEQKKELKLYLSEGKSRKALIHQMIENQLVQWKLDSKQEKETKDVYEKMKDSWVDLVRWDNSKNQFVINQEKFAEILACFGGSKIASIESTGDSIYLSQVTHDESLLKKNESQININLLKKSLLILVFKNYSLNIEGIGAYIKVKQKRESGCLKRFLRADLREVSFSDKGNIGYGIMYKIVGDRLEFSGVADKHLENEILVVQITNFHERILKEFWIHGVAHENSEMMKSYGVL